MTLEQELEKMIRTMRLYAHFDRADGKEMLADAQEKVAMQLERLLTKYNHPVPVCPGYPRGLGRQVRYATPSYV